MSKASDDRLLRLIDLEPHETIVISCECGRIVEYGYGFLQRRFRLASDMLVWDLQFRLRCKRCQRTQGFEIAIFDERGRGNSARLTEKRVIVRRQ